MTKEAAFVIGNAGIQREAAERGGLLGSDPNSILLKNGLRNDPVETVQGLRSAHSP